MAPQGGRAHSCIAFDWLMAVMTVLAAGGFLLDGYAHSHGFVDQSFFTPWHALLYGAIALNGLILLGAGIHGLRRGYSFRNALPPGYWTAALGIVVFLAAGGFDGWWHTVFGIESGIVLLISPPHLILAVSGAMLHSGPLFSVASRYGRDVRGWLRVGPAILSTWAILTSLGFFLAYAQPIEDGFTPLTFAPDSSGAVYPMLEALDAKGTLTRLALAPKTDAGLVAVSPDGRMLAYRVDRFQDPDGTPPSDIYVSGADGAHAVRITGSGRHDTLPQWSPDGRTLAYVSMPAETSGDYVLVAVRPDGSGARELLRQTTRIGTLAWSPDGQQIAFGSHRGLEDMLAVLDVATGTTRWLPFSAGASSPAWTRSGLYYAASDGSIVRASIDGSNARTIVRKSDGSPIVSPDGRRLAYLATELGAEQLFLADSDGKNARDVTQLSGMDVQAAAFGPGGRLVFAVSGRKDAVHAGTARELAMAALIIQAIVVAGAVLLLVYRFNVPLGGIALLLTGFALAMAIESDMYAYALGALVTGIVADALIAAFKEQVRAGIGFYALGALVPLLFTAFYQIVTVQTIGTNGWVWNLLLGAPFIAGVAGLMIAFCFDPPLRQREASA